ncbi:MAG TPA: GNAT family N-acetyltransferase [Herpetosiphonaceae bacterium]
MTEALLATESIDVPGAPALPGLRFRRFRGPADYQLMVDLANLCSRADGDEWVSTLQNTASFYEHPINFNPREDMLFAEVDGQLIAYGRSEWRQIEDGPRTYLHLGWVHPDWRGKGLGAAMLAWNENRLRQVAAEQGYAGEKVFRAHGAEINPGGLSLLENAGYKVVRFGYDMVRDLTAPIEEAPMPEGLEIRPVTPDDYRAVWNADVEAFRDHWGYSEPTEADFQRWQAGMFFQPEIWKIGWAGDEVAGMVLNFIMHEENRQRGVLRGYTEGISVRRAWRRLGLARALLTSSMLMFREMGMTEAALGVDAENPNGALGLYESVGFKVVRRGFTYEKPL